MEEYKEHPYVHETNRFFAEKFLESRRRGVKIESKYMFNSTLKINQLIYSLSNADKNSKNENNIGNQNNGDIPIL